MRKHQVVFCSPGTFTSEVSAKDIESWDTKKAVKMAKNITERHGAKPYGFYFETLLVSPDVPDGEGGMLKVQPKVVEKSGVHFLGGELQTYDDVLKRNDSKEEILRSNMRYNDMWIVCVNTNSYRSTMPFEEKDALVDDQGNIVARGNDKKHVSYRKTAKAQYNP
jgi:hypothetical protein